MAATDAYTSELSLGDLNPGERGLAAYADAVAGCTRCPLAKGRTQALTLVPARTTDAVPVVIGGVLALVMLTVFGAAAAMTKLAR